MSSLAVLGAGAFGTALAIALSRNGSEVELWGRDSEDLELMQSSRKSGHRLPGFELPETVRLTASLDDIQSELCLVAIPTQKLSGFLAASPSLANKTLVACCKGIDLQSGLGPVRIIESYCPGSTAGILTGPSFAVDLAANQPTALVVATHDPENAKSLQAGLMRPKLRLYRSTDTIGAELGGALKNVVALAAGITIGAGLGDSARASVIARGFAEMTRFAVSKGAQAETLMGLSGLGDLVLTCTSEKSRNFSAGLAIGRGEPLPHVTIEGVATAQAVANSTGEDLPLTSAIAKVVVGELAIDTAIEHLLSRPATEE